jgi:hypothetical protein
LKFTFAWARMAAQNVTLKVATAILGVISVAQLFAVVSLALRAPVVIERGCISRSIALASPQHSTDEITAFLREVLPQRFDTDQTPRADFFSLEELSSREKEQAVLGEKQMRQRFLFGDALVSEKEILVSGDRLISVGKIKSVLPLRLRISVKQVPRSEANPYGLVLAQVSEVIDQKEEKK